ncbi:MAG: hypothetical protein DDT42_02004 [candidate division WS2 bacterium]|uniref:Uncharacterized protein n=1 Tax=Psychracetigena formicireducens TaxID=2986056 RepID=A0A9E2BJ51_PSYF1|nr:hypothetical protein [Candidatus Psychracetigena formicireducens]MBT9146122.1 hypothetical protein [Candidatus Psychracetigena formicireducens]
MLKPYRWFKVLVKIIGVAIIIVAVVESLSIISPPNTKHFKTYFELDVYRKIQLTPYRHLKLTP